MTAPTATSSGPQRFAPHVAPINRLVDELGTQVDAGPPPYVAPMYRGVHAPALAVLRDPGPKAGGAKGSGFLSVENDDQTAERQCHFFVEAGLDSADVLPWNAYPWYINTAPTAAQLAAGIEPLRRVIELMPQLQVILLLGKDAQHGWRLFTNAHPGLIGRCGITALSTYHPSRGALQHPDHDERASREDDIRTTLRRAATIVTPVPGPPRTAPCPPDIAAAGHERSTTDRHAAAGSSLLRYAAFHDKVVPADGAPLAQIVEDLVRIISVEGPILGHRLHGVYARSSAVQGAGVEATRSVNRAVTEALRQGLLVVDDPLGESGVKPRTFRTPDQPPVLLRELGPRCLLHIPPAELAMMLRAVADEVGWDTASLFPALAVRYGIGQLRPSDRVRLDSVLRLASPM